MKINYAASRSGRPRVEVILSRNNLRTLLYKLDEESSLKTLDRLCEDGTLLIVRAEDDEEHYAERPRGIMHPREEAKLRNVE